MQSRKYRMVFAISLMFIALLTGCSRNTAERQNSVPTVEPEENMEMIYTADTKIWDVIDDPVFADSFRGSGVPGARSGHHAVYGTFGGERK
jgi:hypothetical protein